MFSKIPAVREPRIFTDGPDAPVERELAGRSSSALQSRESLALTSKGIGSCRVVCEGHRNSLSTFPVKIQPVRASGGETFEALFPGDGGSRIGLSSTRFDNHRR